MIANIDLATIVTLVALAFAAIAYGIRETLDLLGKSPSGRRLRVENEDLIRRNTELDQTVQRLELEVADLKEKVATLRERDQGAVLDALERHERAASERASETTDLLRAILSELKSQHP